MIIRVCQSIIFSQTIYKNEKCSYLLLISVIIHYWKFLNEKSYDLSKKFYVEWDDFYWTVHNEQTGENPGQSYVQIAQKTHTVKKKQNYEYFSLFISEK